MYRGFGLWEAQSVELYEVLRLRGGPDSNEVCASMYTRWVPIDGSFTSVGGGEGEEGNLEAALINVSMILAPGGSIC